MSNPIPGPSSTSDGTRSSRHSRVNSEIPVPLIPDAHLQYGSSRGNHRYAPSEQLNPSVPGHEPSLSITENNIKEDAYAAGLSIPGQSPFATPNVDQVGPPPPAGNVPPVMSSQFGTPQFLMPSQFPANFVRYSGSPGPLLSVFSPNPNLPITGLTPLIGTSPFSNTQGFEVDSPFTTSQPKTDEQDSEMPPLKRKLQNIPEGAGKRHHSISEAQTPDGVHNESQSQQQETSTSDLLMKIPSDNYDDPNYAKEWSDGDIEELIKLLEPAEKFKWKYISDQFYKKKSKRIPPVACTRKFKEMFGTPECSSRLTSSLFYVTYRTGWDAIKEETTEFDKESRKSQQDN